MWMWYTHAHTHTHIHAHTHMHTHPYIHMYTYLDLETLTLPIRVSQSSKRGVYQPNQGTLRNQVLNLGQAGGMARRVDGHGLLTITGPWV